jgi:[ribosomal protein S5]-alanine N-acetyltransferase
MRLLTPWRTSDEPRVLQGRQAELRSPAMQDYAQWSSLRIESRDFLEQWEPEWDHSELTRSSYRLRMKRYRELQEADLAYPFFIWAGDILVGAITVSNVRRGISQSGTLGYWIGKKFARQGFMSEALQLCAQFAFSDLRLHRLEAACLPYNEASITLLTKAGFEEEGYAKSYLKIAGRWSDHVLFSRVNPRMG